MQDLGLYPWQYLEQQPYGRAIWDIAEVQGTDAVIFLIRESRADVTPLPEAVDVYWKAGGVGMKVAGWRVMPVVIMIKFLSLGTMYEMWFNFYGEAGPTVQKAFTLLGKQDRLYIILFDTGPIPVRSFGFPNNIQHFFRGQYGMIKAITPWDDNLFNLAKLKLQSERGVQELWNYLK